MADVHETKFPEFEVDAVKRTYYAFVQLQNVILCLQKVVLLNSQFKTIIYHIQGLGTAPQFPIV